MSDFKQMMEKKNEPPTMASFVRPNYSFHSDYLQQFSCPDTTIGGIRHYAVSTDVKYPSITTVLGGSKSARAQKSLDNWKKREGEVKAEKIRKEAAERGHKLHNVAQWFMQEDYRWLGIKNEKDIKLFGKIYPLMKRINNIRAIESVLFLHALGLAGRVDVVADFDNELSIIDFKGSTKVKEEYFIRDYFIQETFYALAYSKMYNCKVKKIVTIMATEASDTPQLFVKNAVDYIPDLTERVKEYHKRLDNAPQS